MGVRSIAMVGSGCEARGRIRASGRCWLRQWSSAGSLTIPGWAGAELQHRLDLDGVRPVLVRGDDRSPVEHSTIKKLYEKGLSSAFQAQKIQGVVEGEVSLLHAFSKFSLPWTRTHPDVLFSNTSTWSTLQTGRNQSLSCCHEVSKGS